MMAKQYLILTPYLPEGKMLTNACLKWHERLRIKMAKWLFLSIPLRDMVEITTTSGVVGYDDSGIELRKYHEENR